MKKVYFINLDERGDRKKSFVEEMKKYNLEDDNIVVRFPAIKTSPGYIGCAQSHLEILKNFKKTSIDESSVAIFEDDFVWKVDDPETVNETLERFFQSTSDWDVIALAAGKGGIKTESTEHVKGVRRVYSFQTATAYIVNSRYVDTLIENFEFAVDKLKQGKPYEKYALDQYWKQLQSKDKWYVTMPGFGKQRPDYSDIEGKITSYMFI